MPQSFKASWNSWLQYWLPLSLWNITPGGGLRRHHAIASASLTRLACMCASSASSLWRRAGSPWPACRRRSQLKYPLALTSSTPQDTLTG
jgi:hypothetical protein